MLSGRKSLKGRNPAVLILPGQILLGRNLPGWNLPVRIPQRKIRLPQKRVRWKILQERR